MNALVEAALSRTRATLSVLFVILAGGLSAYFGIPKDGDPDVQIPFVVITAFHEGASPEDTERLLGRPLERELRSLEGLVDIQTFAAESTIGIILEFAMSVDIDEAVVDVREKVDLAKAEFPDDTEEPIVAEFNTATEPVIRLAVAGSAPERTLVRMAKDLADAIKEVSAVLDARLYGYREEVLEVIIDHAQLDAYRVGVADVIQSVALNNRLVAAGAVDTGAGRFAVKVPGLIETRRDLLNLPVVANADAVVTLGDITEIRRTFEDARGFATYNGEPAIGIAVSKRIDENIIATSEAVRAVIARETANWPETVTVHITLDESERVFDILTDLRANVVNAIALVIAIVVLALGFRSALLVGVAIPTSFLFAFLMMSTFGMTANMMVIFGLIVAVGMLVDGAIVVVEYADRKIAQGFDRRIAYGAAATRMFWPIISSTLTTLAAFLPLLLWPGVTGDYMRFLPLTLIFTLTGSLLVAVFFLPALASVLGRSGSGADTSIARALDPIADAEADRATGDQPLAAAYTRLLKYIIRRPGLVLGVAVVFLVTVFFVYGRLNHGVILTSSEEPPGAQIIVTARGNLSAVEARQIVADVEHAILETDGVARLFAYAGPATEVSPFDNFPRDTIGEMYMNFVDWRGRRPVVEIFADIRRAVETIPGIHVEITPFAQSLGRSKDVVLELLAADRSAAPAAAARVRNFMETEMDGLIDIDDTGPLPGIEWIVNVDRSQAQRFGANVSVIGGVVQLVTSGLKIGEYRPDDADEEIDIRMRLPANERGFTKLDTLRVMTDFGLVPITNFVSREARPRVNTIERRNGAWAIMVRANTVDGVLADDKVKELRRWLEETDPLPAGVSYRFGGEDRLQAESSGFLGQAFLAALFLMALILLTQFNNFYQSLLILSAVIMSTAGVLIGMLVMVQPFSMILTGTGIIALAGIVVNNNIVLIDTYQRLVKAGVDRLDAVVQAGAQRLRPILLTTVTTMAGLMPMVLQLSFDPFSGTFSTGSPTSYFWQPMSNAIVFGLGFSTILTLIMTPAALALPVQARARWNRIFPANRRVRGTAPVADREPPRAWFGGGRNRRYSPARQWRHTFRLRVRRKRS